MMDGEPGKVMSQIEPSRGKSPALEDRLAMLEQKQASMERMMAQAAMMSSQDLMPSELLNESPMLPGNLRGGLGMMGGIGMTPGRLGMMPGGMLGGASTFALERRLMALERQLLVMREILKGLMVEQSLLLK